MTLEGQRKGQQPLLYSGLNERTGQHGIIESDFIHVVPTMERPDSKILVCVLFNHVKFQNAIYVCVANNVIYVERTMTRIWMFQRL